MARVTIAEVTGRPKILDASNSASVNFVPTIANATQITFAGRMLAGLSFNGTTGAITGQATEYGYHRGAIVAQNAENEETLAIITANAKPYATIQPNYPPSGLPSAAPSSVTIAGVPGGGQVGAAFSYTPTVTGGSGTKSFVHSGAALPSWASFSTSTGAISGTPDTVGTIALGIVTVNDSGGTTASTGALTVAVIAATLTISGSPPAGTVGTAYTFTPGTSGGNGTKAFAHSGAALPGWAAFSTTTGAITGTPDTAGTIPLGIITVTDLSGSAATAALSASIVAAPVALAISGSPPGGNVGNAYIYTPSVVGGSTPYAFAHSGAALPSWATFSTATGAISGTPDTAGTIALGVVTVTDHVGATSATGALTATIGAAAPTFTTVTMTPAYGALSS